MSTKKKVKKIGFKFSKQKLIIFAIIVCLSVISLFFSAKIERAIGINSPFYSRVSEDDYIIHFIDVGQGDCTIFEFPNDEIMVVDAGPATNKIDLQKYLDKVVFENGNKTIDYLVATHSDSDHVGNMEFLLANYEVKNVYRPDIYSKSEDLPEGKRLCDTNVYDNFIKAVLNENGCDVKTLGNFQQELIKDENNNVIVEINFFGPLEDYYADVNDYSPFIVVECNGNKCLITGDLGIEGEQDLLTSYPFIFEEDVDIYHCGHHGSKTSTSEELLEDANPKYAVISCEKGNSYGHPNAETLAKLNANKIEIYNTAENGNIIFAYEEDGDQTIATGDFDSLDVISWWMVVLTIDVLCAIVIFSIKLKTSKKL